MAAADEDLYQILGVAKNASPDEIQAAYKQKARKLHPDVNKSDTAEEDFKSLAAAYAILKDPDQRKRYDTYGLAGPPQGPSPDEQAWSGGFSPQDFNFGGGIRFEDININLDDLQNPFDFFSRRHSRGRGRSRPRPARLQEVMLKITLEQAFLGAKLNVMIDLKDPRGFSKTHQLKLRIPAGAKEGDRVTLKEPPCVVVLSVEPDPRFEVSGRDLTTEVRVSPPLAALGGEVEVQTPGGQVKVKVPEGSSSGQRLRLRGAGLPQKPGRPGEPGDLYVKLSLTLPKVLSHEAKALYQELRKLELSDS